MTDCCNHGLENSCLHRVPIFEALLEEEISDLNGLIISKPYRKGETVFLEGEKSDSLFIVNQGTVKLYKSSELGKEQTIRFLFSGDFFGQLALLQEQSHYASAEAIESAVVCRIEKKDFHRLLESNHRLAYRVLLAVSDRLQQADEWMGTISLFETDKRLAKTLIHFYEKNGASGNLQLPVPKKELAAWLGTTPETLSRKLAHFEELGLLAMEGRSIRILQPEELLEYAR